MTKRSKSNNLLWILFFLICMGVGFLHGILPDGISRSYLQSPTQIQVITTDEILFPLEIRQKIEKELHVRFSVSVNRDWNSILAHVVASPGVDLLFMPSYWGRTLEGQHLLEDISSLQNTVASDFRVLSKDEAFTFVPYYWMKTHIQSSQRESFDDFLKNKNDNVIFLLADEDLILSHFQSWKAQGILDLVMQKKILTLQLDQILTEDPRLGAVEGPLTQEFKEKNNTQGLKSLLVWGAAIPKSSAQKQLALKTLELFLDTKTQEDQLSKTPFNSALNEVKSDQIPLQRRAEAVRNLQMKDTIIIEKKDKEAKNLLRDQFNFIL